ncbi:hypothetical protein [Oceanobacillus kimchii]|nr:hypothetical protein [Oceanobacillus kimchii]
MASIITGVGVTAFVSIFASVGLGTMAIGVGATIAFEFAYEVNFLGLQDGLDWAGQQFDKGWETITNWVGDVGQAMHNSWNILNPFSTA